jgi:hypothetical protein
MKKISLMLFVFTVVALTAQAQPGGQRRTVEERVASIHAKLDSAFKLDAAKLTALDSTFATYYRDQDAKRQEMFAGGTRPDRETMMAEMQKFVAARDEKLKTILTEDQFKIWKEQIEPAMRPQRQGGNR